jgi:hypothetical protein
VTPVVRRGLTLLIALLLLGAALVACDLNPQQLPPVAGEGTSTDAGSQNNPPQNGGEGDGGVKADASSDAGAPREDAGDASAAGPTLDASDAGDASDGACTDASDDGPCADAGG